MKSRADGDRIDDDIGVVYLMGENMKSIGFGLLAVCLSASAAHAEGFQGFYAGLEGGYDGYEVKVDDIDISDVAGFPATASFDGLSGNGAVGGVFAGYHLGGRTTFVAIEGFAQFSGASVGVSATDGVDTVGLKVEAKESFGAAARLGMKVNQATGVYARIGWLTTKFEGTLDDGVDIYSDSTNEDAIQYGVGLETMVSDQVSLRSEYLRASYGDQGVDGLSIDNNSFKAGLAVRF